MDQQSFIEYLFVILNCVKAFLTEIFSRFSYAMNFILSYLCNRYSWIMAGSTFIQEMDLGQKCTDLLTRLKAFSTQLIDVLGTLFLSVRERLMEGSTGMGLGQKYTDLLTRIKPFFTQLIDVLGTLFLSVRERFQSQRSIKMAEPVRIGVCTSAQTSSIKALVTKLADLANVEVTLVDLPYNDLDSYWLPAARFDAIILCHSIHNRRFAITDVMDALYDKFLPHARDVTDKQRVTVAVHDFPWPMGSDNSKSTTTDHEHASIKRAHLDSFRVRQPTTFENSALAIICGKLDDRIEMDDEDLQQLASFVTNIKPFSFLHTTVTKIVFVILNVAIFIICCAKKIPYFPLTVLGLGTVIVCGVCLYVFFVVVSFLIPIIGLAILAAYTAVVSILISACILAISVYITYAYVTDAVGEIEIAQTRAQCVPIRDLCLHTLSHHS